MSHLNFKSIIRFLKKCISFFFFLNLNSCRLLLATCKVIYFKLYLISFLLGVSFATIKKGIDKSNLEKIFTGLLGIELKMEGKRNEMTFFFNFYIK